MRLLFTILGIVLVTAGYSQELKELRHSRTEDFKMDFYINLSKKKVKYEDTLHYYWFRSQKIHITQGSADGSLLHGKFTKFYDSEQLAEKGQFEQGLKDGEWKSWFESGKLKSIYHYHKGVLTGSYTLYYESGDIRETGKFRGGDKKVDGEKEKPEKLKKKRDWSGTVKLTEERKKRQEAKRVERERKRQERRSRKEKEGNFFQRFFKKDKSKNKRTKE